jgi:hypothetical protein
VQELVKTRRAVKEKRLLGFGIGFGRNEFMSTDWFLTGRAKGAKKGDRFQRGGRLRFSSS